MKKIVLTLCAALICTAGLSAHSQQTGPAAPKPEAKVEAPSPAGNWNMSLDAGQGPMDIAVTLKLDGKKITGMLSSQMGDTALVGEVGDGGKVTFSISFDGGGGAMELVFIGTMKDADNATGTMNGPMGEIPFVMKRVKG